jgi:hypothetical protein
VHAKINYVTLTYTLIAPAVQIDTSATALSRAARNEATPLTQLTQAARIAPAPIEPGRKERAPASKCPGTRFEDATPDCKDSPASGPNGHGHASWTPMLADPCQEPVSRPFFVAFDTTDFDV